MFNLYDIRLSLRFRDQISLALNETTIVAFLLLFFCMACGKRIELCFFHMQMRLFLGGILWFGEFGRERGYSYLT